MLRWICLGCEKCEFGGFEFLLQRYKKYIRYPKFFVNIFAKILKKNHVVFMTVWIETTAPARTKNCTRKCSENRDFATFFAFFGGKNE